MYPNLRKFLTGSPIACIFTLSYLQLHRMANIYNKIRLNNINPFCRSGIYPLTNLIDFFQSGQNFTARRTNNLSLQDTAF